MHYFHLNSLKKQPPSQTGILVPQTTEKLPKLSQNGSQQGPKIHQQFIKIEVWAQRYPQGCPGGPLDHQNGPPGFQNGASGPPISQIWVLQMTLSSGPAVRGTASMPTSKPAVSKPAEGGRRQGRSLHILIIYLCYSITHV